MHTPTAPGSFSAALVAVLDAMPDPPETFTAADVLDALAEARAAGVEGTEGLDAGSALGAMLVAELASLVPGTRRYVVHAEARPF